MGENVTFDLSVSTLKAGIWRKKLVENGKNCPTKMINLLMKLKQKVASCGSQMQKNRGSLGKSDQRAHISQKNVGSLGDTRDSHQNMGSLGDSNTENRGFY